MKKLLTISIQKRWLMLALFLLLGFFGYYSGPAIHRSLSRYRRCNFPVVTQVPGLAAEEVEQQITIPLERSLNGLPGNACNAKQKYLRTIHHYYGFDDGTDDYWARQRIQERLTDVELPYGAQPGLDPLTSPIGEVYRYIIESNNHSLRELTDLQKNL